MRSREDRVKEQSALPVRQWHVVFSLMRQGMSLRLILWAYLPITVLLLSLGVVALTIDFPVEDLLSDPAEVAGVPWYTGAVSHLGILLWNATATVCFLTVALLWRAKGSAESRRFFLSAGILTTLLTVDDLFMLHDEVIPRLLSEGQRFMALLYGLLMLGFLIRFRRFIIAHSGFWLMIAIGFLGMSLLTDIALDLRFTVTTGASRPYIKFIEDGFKLLGITTWFIYFISVMLRTLPHRTTSNSVRLREGTSLTPPGT